MLPNSETSSSVRSFGTCTMRSWFPTRRAQSCLVTPPYLKSWSSSTLMQAFRLLRELSNWGRPRLKLPCANYARSPAFAMRKWTAIWGFGQQGLKIKYGLFTYVRDLALCRDRGCIIQRMTAGSIWHFIGILSTRCQTQHGIQFSDACFATFSTASNRDRQ